MLFGYKVANYLSKNCPELIITRSFISSIFFTYFKINHFLDRTTGYGTTWFYSVATRDISGRKILSDFIEGRKNP